MDSTNSPQSLEQSGAIGGTTAGQQQAAFYGQAVAEQTLRAYHDDPTIKLKYIGRMRTHQEADELVHGIYWEGGKGCAIGCTVHSSEHKAYETELGMPEWFARLEDTIFENMSGAASCRFPMSLLSTIPVGFAEWDRLYHEFCAYILRDVCKFDRKAFPDVATAVDDIVRLHEQMTEDDDQAWSVARSAAESADTAAWSVSLCAAASADAVAQSTRSAQLARSARSAACVADAAAVSAEATAVSADAVALVANESAAYDRMGDWLVRRFDAADGSR